RRPFVTTDSAPRSDRCRAAPKEPFEAALTCTMLHAFSGCLRERGLFRQKGFDGIVDHRCERNHISQGDEWRRLNVIGLVLLHAGVTERYLLLVIQPILVVRAETGIQNPLLKSKAAVFGIVRDRLSIGIAGVFCKMRRFTENTAPSVD